jgi:RND family efflux transporter MFP subunit
VRRTLKWLLPVLAVAIIGAAVGRAVLARRAAQAVPPAVSAPAAMELAAIDLVGARQVSLARRLDVSGSLKAVTTAFVKARVAGELRALAPREGDAVRAGEVIGHIDSTEFDWRLRQAEQTAKASRAQLDIARRTLDNNKALVAQGFISETALDTAVSNAAAAEANLQAALAGVELAKKARADATLVAPIAGLVSQRLVQPGERVGIDTRVIEIVDLSRLELEAAVAPEDAVALRVGQPATLRIDGLAQALPARVARINPSAQPGSRAVPVYLTVEPHPALRHGLFARGGVELDSRSALAVPASAVRRDQARPYVLVVDGARAVQRPVVTGMAGVASGTEMVEIAQGLREGELVLAGSAGAVRDGTPVRVPPSHQAAR